MENIYLDILGGLEEERDILKKLINLSTGKTEALATRDLEKIHNIVEKEQELITKVERLESLRRSQIQKLSKLKNIPEDSIIISSIIEWTKGDIKTRFQSLMEDIEKIVAEQKELNRINSEIVKANISYFDFFIKALTGESSSGPVYEKEGKVAKGTQSQNIFDTKA